MTPNDHGRIALHAASPLAGVALCAALALADQRPAAGTPEWIQLLPAGTVSTQDGRGPYKVADAAAVLSSSLQMAGGRLPVDEAHATDLAAPRGDPAPARGWIVELQARADGIWGRVEWTAEGAKLVADRAYRFISPVIRHLADGTVTEILRASLVNTPNLRGMTALNQETNMDLLAKLREILGLAADADEAAIIAAITGMKEKASGAVAAQSAFAKAAGLKEDATTVAIQTAITQLVANGGKDKDATITALQTELTNLGTELKTTRDGIARDKATAAVDAAITAGKPGVKLLRDHYITRHMADPVAVDKEFAGMPSLTHSSGAGTIPPTITKDKDGKSTVALNAAQEGVAKVLGISAEAMGKTVAAEAEAAAAL